MNSPQRLLPTLLFVAAVTAGVSGCAVFDETDDDYIQPGTTDLVVERLEFQGVDNVSERELRNGLATVEDPGWRATQPWAVVPMLGAQRRYYNRFAWRQDRERILSYYRQQGYYSASIDSESIIEDPDEGTVHIRVTINEGEPTTVDHLQLHGLIDDQTPDRRTLLEDLPLREGDIFRQADYQNVRSQLINRLRDAGHAYAEIEGRVEVDPENHRAEVNFYLAPGPRTQFGPVYVLGLDEIDEQAVRQTIPFDRGEPYDPDVLNRTQEQIYDLGVFGMVTVLPAHEARQTTVDRPDDQQRLEQILDEHDVVDPQAPSPQPSNEIGAATGAERSALGVSALLGDAQRYAESRARLDPEVPIVIRVQETTGYNLRVGTGVAVESTRQDVRALINWSSRNFLGGLRRLEHFNAVGYAWAPSILTPQHRLNRGVILSSELRFRQPQFLEPRTNLRMRARVDRDVREGFSMWNPSFRIALERSFFRHLIVSASYNVAYFNYFNVEEGLLDPTATELGLDFENEFLLEHLEQSIAYDRRDNIIDPTRGYLIDLTMQQAGRFAVGGEFDFIRPVLSTEGYIPVDLLGPAVLAMRARFGTAYDVGRDTGVPHQHRLYSGGADGMRSFGRRRLSLYTPAGEPVPIGGLTQFEASLEPRFRLVSNLLGMGDLWGALFLDSATVLGGQFLVDTDSNTGSNIHDTVEIADIPRTLLYGLGAGTWWNTPVGPVRLDVAYTLSNITGDPRFRRCEDPADYGTPGCELVPIDEDPIQDLLVGQDILPAGWAFHLSIGHSF